MAEEQALEPKVERIVEFYGDIIPVAQGANDEVFVPLRPVAEFLGLDYASQYQRIHRDDEMTELCRIVTMQIPGDSQRRAVFCIPLKLMPTWLFGITTSRVKPELREKLSRYRREVFDVLWNAFKGDIMPAVPPPVDLTPAEQMLAQAEAIAGIARQQVELERRQNDMANFMRPYVQKTSRQLADHEYRLISLELRLDPEANITDEQAAEIAGAVKNVAYLPASGGYGKVYSELYRRYRISGYKSLKRKDYETALKWLSELFEELTRKGNNI